MGVSSKAPSSASGVTPLDLILSCHVCNATFSEIYAGHHDTVHGLTDGINPKDRLVTRFFMAECSHTFCSKHLEGGAPAFHPSGTRPSAPCPICVREKGDNRPRNLFSIRGFRKGEYDDSLDSAWFITPPLKLDTSGKEMDALRFQYTNLIRYSRRLTADYAKLKGTLEEVQHHLTTIKTLGAEEHAKVLALEQDNQRLRSAEAELQKLKARTPAFKHYLKLVPKLAEQNDQMRQQLASLGFHVPAEPLSYNEEPYPFGENDNVIMDYSDQPSGFPNRGVSSRTAGRSVDTGTSGEDFVLSGPQVRPFKRQRVDSPLPETNIHAPPPRSRDLMPPPNKPLSRMKSMKRFLPSLRKKHSNGQSLPASHSEQIPEADAQMDDNEQWGRADQPEEQLNDNDYDRPPTRHGMRGETPYMVGGLPVGCPPRVTDSPLPQQRPDFGAQGAQSEFTFRATPPVKQVSNQPNGLPTERSYIRLMDGLGHDPGLQLGLQDPRHHENNNTVHQERPIQDTYMSPKRHGQAKASKRWSFGHAFLHQSPKGVSQHPDPLRSNPTANDMAQSQYNHVTPALQRVQQPAPRGENIVSPFFDSSSRNSHAFTWAGVAERSHSSIHSDTYQFQRPKATATSSSCHEPRSLNALSFFNSPCNTKNEPIAYGPEPSIYRGPPQQPYQAYLSRNLNSRGLITRSNTERSPFLNDSTYGSFDRPSHSRQTRAPLQHSIPFPSFSRPSISRPSRSQAAPLPSSMPSIVSSQRSPLRSTRTNWKALASTGVRSSQPPARHIPGNTFASPSTGLFSRSGRRSVRR